MSSSQVIAGSSDFQERDPDAGPISRVSRVYKWQILPELQTFTTPTMLCVGRRFFLYKPDTILKLGPGEGEAAMTELAHNLLGSVAPSLEARVLISTPQPIDGILISLQPGTPLVELWSELSLMQRTLVKENLVALLVRMRASRARFDYYGRPFSQPYTTPTENGSEQVHAFCRTRSEWDTSRVDALHAATPVANLQELERIQKVTAAGGVRFVDAAVLTHGDLSYRNILVNRDSLEITGLIDWEMANVAPTYFEYAQARILDGHLPEWRKELLEVLRQVLQTECEREVATSSRATASERKKESEELYKNTLAAWNAFVDVERIAQGYSDECYWTFEEFL